MGTLFYKSSRVALLNKQKKAKTCENLADANRLHWMKALIRHRLRNYSVRLAKPMIIEIHDTKEATVCRTPMAAASSSMEDDLGQDNASDGPPSKKLRNKWL